MVILSFTFQPSEPVEKFFTFAVYGLSPIMILIGWALAAVRQAAALLRRLRRQYGFAHQPLHRQQEGPQRRRLFPRRADRLAARSGDVTLLPTLPRSLSRRAGDRRRRRGLAAPAG